MEDRRKRSRKWGFACLNCRKKKVRCDGGKPQCVNCVKTGDECAYKASDAVNTELAAEVRRRHDELASLKGRIRALSGLSGANRDAAVSELASTCDHVSPDIATFSETSPAEATRVSELSVDDDGHIRHYGATSRFYSKPYENEASEPDQGEEEYHRKWLRSNARFQSSWEARAMERLNEPPICNNIDPASAQILLEIYWTWQAPLHNCVYRRCFYRDMALGGPYFSIFLLYVLFAHAGRHIRADNALVPNFGKGEPFMLKVKKLLVDELETPRIPTIQGLLILGGRQCAIGKTSEGWLYTSMAVSMIKDLGLHLRKDAGSLLKHLEPDDLEARKRLYLSAYIWDKSISLCVGRQPSLPEMPYPNDCLLDDADNAEIWQPKHLENLSEFYPQPTYTHNTDNFLSFVKLATIINEVYIAVYSNDNKLSLPILYGLEHKLRHFHGSLQQHLRFEGTGEGTVSPPPHISTVNILYHTALILLFRPFYQSTQPSPALRELSRHAHAVCKAEAEAVNACFRAHGRTFHYRNQTHLLSYCVYTAATIDVQGMQSKDPSEAREATERLEVTLRMLDTEAEQTPGVRRSVDIIRAQIAQIARKVEHRSALPTPSEQPDPLDSPINQMTAVRTQESSEVLGQAHSAHQPGVISMPPGGEGPWATPMYSETFEQPIMHSSDQISTDQAYNQMGNTPWMDWNDLDISGGFGPYDYSAW